MATSRNSPAYSDDIVDSRKLFNVKLSSVQNINRSLSDLQPISRYDAQIEVVREYDSCQPPTYQQFNRSENPFEGDSSRPSWNRTNETHRNVHNVSLASPQNMILMTENVQSQPNSSTLNLQQVEDGRLRNAFPSSHRLVGGFSVNQAEGERDDKKDAHCTEKRKLTRRYFVSVFSICYAMFLVVFGAIVFIGDVVDSQYPLAQVFCMYMLIMAFAYFLYLYVDIRLYVVRAKKDLRERMNRKERIDKYIVQNILNLNGGSNSKEVNWTEAVYVQAIRELNLPALEAIEHRYCFITGREGDSLYLKLGASWFAFGLLVYSALQITYDAYFISSNGDYLYECASYITLALNILFPVYSMFSLFFIVKYMNVVVNVNQSVARIFLMHAIGTSLAMWVFTIVRETADAIAESDAENHELLRTGQLNETIDFVYNDCGKSNALNAVHRQFAPYLYPFVIEYCILIVGIWYKIHANVNRCPQKVSNTNVGLGMNDAAHTSTNAQSSQKPMTENEYYLEKSTEHEKDIGNSTHVYVDCQSSFRGIFVGLLLAIMTIVLIILMFVGFQNRSYLNTSIMINNVYECAVQFILIFATIIAYSQTIKLDIEFDPVLKMDDILLLIAIPAFFMESIFSLAPAIRQGAFLPICISVCRVIQILIQTPFIIDGKRRCSNSPHLQEKKVGRGFVIFLAIANMSLWIYHTFSGRTTYASDDRYTFYGYTMWNILNHISLPLIMFYRFHSSVCLVDIWNHAYKTIEMQPFARKTS